VTFIDLQRALLRRGDISAALRINAAMARARVTCSRALRTGHYHLLSETDLKALKTSDRVFVFGSGYSLHDLTEHEWLSIAEHNTIGFNTFLHQRWVRVDFHLTRGWGESANLRSLPVMVERFVQLATSNPLYTNTVFVYQDDYTALFAHSLLASRGLHKHTRIFPYHTRNTGSLPGRTFTDGLVHAMGTLCDAVNLAVCLGYGEVVLVGVDLYDSRYFWAPSDKTIAIDGDSGQWLMQDRANRGQLFSERHSTATNGIVALLDTWHQYLRSHGVTLSVYNPKSLLASIMPTFERPTTPGERHAV
jgi:hypothetical protein